MFQQQYGSRSNSRSFEGLFKFQDISPKTQQHLTRVYTVIMACCLFCATGMFLNSTMIFQGFLSTIFSLVCMIYFAYQVSNQKNTEFVRLSYLGGIAFFLGFMVGPMMHMLAEVHPQIIVQALLYTAVSFVSFTLISLYSKRRSYLYLGGIIMTMINAMVLYRLFGWLFGSYNVYNLPYLLFGLFVSCLYVIYDT